MIIPRLKVALAASAIGSGAALLVALGAERWGGLVPCALCLLERWPYRIAGAIALLGVALPRAWAKVAGVLVVLALLAGVGLATTHVGVERGWWPDPLPECAAPRMPAGLSIAERLARMPARPSRACEDPTYLLSWLRVSMSEMNLAFALVFAGSLATFLVRIARSDEA